MNKNLVNKKRFINYLICKKRNNEYIVNDYIIDILLDIVSYIKYLKLSQIIEILNGGYIIIKNDNSYFYNKWRKLEIINNRYSSHKSIKQQYGISAGTLGKYSKNKEGFEILIGVTDKLDINSTWLQFERNKIFDSNNIINGSILFINHIKNYIEYLIKNKNIGPNGESKYIENNPLILRLYQDYKKDKRREKYMKNLKKEKNKYKRVCYK